MSDNSKIKTAWDIWKENFADGDECFVLDEDENPYHGKVMALDEMLLIKPTNKDAIELDWDEIQLVTHAGFPIRKLTGADGSESANLIDTSETTELMRLKLDKEYDRGYRVGKSAGYNSGWNDGLDKGFGIAKDKSPSTRKFTVGDPYLIEDVDALLINPGNDSPLLWSCDGEEVLAMQSIDGARGLLWGIESVFHMEAA